MQSSLVIELRLESCKSKNFTNFNKLESCNLFNHLEQKNKETFCSESLENFNSKIFGIIDDTYEFEY